MPKPSGAPIPTGTSPSEIDQRVAGIEMPKNPPSAGDWVFLASYNENLLEKEFKLQNDRISWMMTSQSVLFAGFCIILTGRLDRLDTGIATRLLEVIPLLAILIIGATICGVFAAQSVVNRLEQERSSYQ